MFVRIKSTPNSPRRSVQLVEGARDGGKVRQRIVRHIGVAMDEDELERLRQLGEYVKAKLEDERQPLLFAPEKIAEQVIRVGRHGDGKQELPVDLKQIEEEQRLVTGVHEVYSQIHLNSALPDDRRPGLQGAADGGYFSQKRRRNRSVRFSSLSRPCSHRALLTISKSPG